MVKAATAPFQHALSTRSGCECVAHALQAVTELDPEATTTTIDGISACDSFSKRAMLLGLDRVAGRQALPFVRLFHSEPSAHLWEDDAGTVHTIRQGEGSEQGDDPFMPLSFSLRHRASLEALQRRMRPTERLMAYLDDIYFVSKPERVGDVVAASVQELWPHARIRVHGGKTHIWNRAGTKPILQRQAEETDLEARVWRGSEVPTTEQGIKVLGTPLGHEDFVNQHLEQTGQKHRKFLRKISTLPDVQSAWLLSLVPLRLNQRTTC